MRYFWISLYLVFLMCSSEAQASPCKGIDLPVSDQFKTAYTPAIAEQLAFVTKTKIEKVDILHLFSKSGWNIIYVDPHVLEPVFLFFNGNPVDGKYVTNWSGAADMFEEQEIKNWAIENAFGIPKQLATCFAWYVMPPHRDQ